MLPFKESNRMVMESEPMFYAKTKQNKNKKLSLQMGKRS